MDFHSGTWEGRILGDDRFTDDILVKVNQKGKREYSLEEVIGAVCANYRITPEKLKAAGKVRPMTEARAITAAVVQMSPHLRLTDLAKLLGRDLSALVKAAQRVATEARGSEMIHNLVDQLGAVSPQMSECQT